MSKDISMPGFKEHCEELNRVSKHIAEDVKKTYLNYIGDKLDKQQVIKGICYNLKELLNE